MTMATLDKCMVCQNDVRVRQDRVTCDTCSSVTHRTCTGIGQTEYRLIKKGLLPAVPYTCSLCINNSVSMLRVPVGESTRLSFNLWDLTIPYRILLILLA